jgi:hypothetical protein
MRYPYDVDTAVVRHGEKDMATERETARTAPEFVACSGHEWLCRQKPQFLFKPGGPTVSSLEAVVGDAVPDSEDVRLGQRAAGDARHLGFGRLAGPARSGLLFYWVTRSSIALIAAQTQFQPSPARVLARFSGCNDSRGAIVLPMPMIVLHTTMLVVALQRIGWHCTSSASSLSARWARDDSKPASLRARRPEPCSEVLPCPP